MTRPFDLPRLGLAVLTVGLLCGCASFLPSSDDLAPRLSLDAGSARAPRGETLPVTLSVADPRSEAVFNTSSVAVQTSPLQYGYLSGAEWTDRAPLMLGLFLERSFENTGLFAAVGDQVSLPVSDYALLTDIRAMHLDRTGGESRAVIAYGARLQSRRGATIGSEIFREEVPVVGTGNDAAVTALNAAAQRIADRTLDWMLPLIGEDNAAYERAREERAQRRATRS
ncbi:ABC-type transport auxiliary lipoprotein family protein [Parvularcula dongshanensis]|uniref:Cholesterol transport system auxiliary component n=1 Tax=Parvularcula dongshanensis TaxID=1173995 RepID=A0A840I0J7_9PROT|nr:ABC-type transport auxiliary lipoprotein family protein [Parvularcula dongshanensis]MBB4657764.1 cholesterol transport system auxiliary component [Parvularcula dongshanensis]